jgi:hypothetical protein
MDTPIHMKGSDQRTRPQTSQSGAILSVASRHARLGMK